MNFIPIRSYDSYITANLVLQQLEAEGIRAYLQDEHTVTIDLILSNAIGGIKLMVPEAQAPRAKELLEAIEKAYKQSVKCPKCGSDNIHFVTQVDKPINWFSAITSWLFGNYAVAAKKVYHCFDCGYESEQLPDAEKP